MPEKCAAHKKTGERCGNWPMHGQKVCGFHGGRAPQNLAAARFRMLELIDPSITALAEVVKDPHAQDSDRIRAAFGILDRCGIGPEQILKVLAVDEPDTWQQLANAYLDRIHEQPDSSGNGHRTIKGELVQPDDEPEPDEDDLDEDDYPHDGMSRKGARRHGGGRDGVSGPYGDLLGPGPYGNGQTSRASEFDDPDMHEAAQRADEADRRRLIQEGQGTRPPPRRRPTRR
jgi:hypothetical protein